MYRKNSSLLITTNMWKLVRSVPSGLSVSVSVWVSSPNPFPHQNKFPYEWWSHRCPRQSLVQQQRHPPQTLPRSWSSSSPSCSKDNDLRSESHVSLPCWQSLALNTPAGKVDESMIDWCRCWSMSHSTYSDGDGDGDPDEDDDDDDDGDEND